MMKIAKKSRKVNITILSLVLLVAIIKPLASWASAPGSSIKSDYVLIINTYTESSDWSNALITPIHKYLFSNKSDLTIYTEHMNMLMINSEDDLEEYKETMFEKYLDRAPKTIIILGNTPWGVLNKEIESRWPKVPVIVCAEEDYNGPSAYYIDKVAIPEELRKPLTSYKGPVNITFIHTPIMLHETIGLMKRMMPNMNKVMFLSDNRYVSAQSRADIDDVVKQYYPGLEVINIVSGSINIDDLADTLRNAEPETGILYFSWYRKNHISGSVVLTTNDYRMFSSYTNQPVFTLTDNEISTSGMLGGCFIDNDRMGDIISSTLDRVLKKKSTKKITVVDSGATMPVINHMVLQHKNISESLCPENTLFVMKQLTLWQEYKYWLLFGLFVVAGAFAFLMLKMQMLAKVKSEQASQIRLMTNYSSLFNNMPIAYSKQRLIYDQMGQLSDYEVVEVNPSFDKYFACAESLVGQKGSRTDNNEFKEYLNLYKIALDDNKAINVQHYHQSTGHYFSMFIVPSQVGGYMDVFYVDNTELSTTQQLLRTLNRKLSMALDVANITPWKWDLDRETILCDVSRTAESTSEDSADEQMSVPYQLYFSKICKRDIARVKQAYDDLLSGKINKIKEEYRVFVHHDNKRSYEWVEAQAVVDKRDESGRPLSLIGSSLVISDRKKMEADLVDAKERAEESNRLKSAFLANMSHEIRTPLNAIVGFSEVLASAEDEQEKHEYVSIIENNNTLLLQLISDILDLSKIEAGTLDFSYSDVDLPELFSELETTFRMRMTNDDVQVIFEESKLDKNCINTDKNRVTQVVINMVNNAMKFTTKGSIRFGFELQGEKMLRFYVTDTGCGIPAEKLDSVFGRFVKLNNFAQGTGLGLSICQTIIHNMGGEIGVDSQDGKGSTFWFTIPYEPVAMVAQPKVEMPLRVVEKAKLTVLIAEDNFSNFKLFEAILKDEYRIIHAWDGEEAVKMFKESKPHIILMDINMPNKNGYEATAEIRKLASQVPIIAVTAYAYSSDEQRIIHSGFDGYAAKPINSQMLKSQMVNLLKRQLIFM